VVTAPKGELNAYKIYDSDGFFDRYCVDGVIQHLRDGTGCFSGGSYDDGVSSLDFLDTGGYWILRQGDGINNSSGDDILSDCASCQG
jgi:hypothetical protein